MEDNTSLNINSSLQDKIDFILNKNINTNTPETQGIYLDSSIINNNFNRIEKSLNVNYEKIRTLEDAINQSKTIISTEIANTLVECKNLLNEIENMNNEYFIDMNNYMSYNIELLNNNNDGSQFVDRNGEILKKASIYNNSIVMNGDMITTSKIKTIEYISNYVPVENNIKDLILNKAYRSKYKLISILNNGVQESLIITLSDLRKINSINIEKSNCSIEQIILIHDNNTSYILNNCINEIFPAKEVKQIKIILKSKAYKKQEYQKNINVFNFFDKLN